MKIVLLLPILLIGSSIAMAENLNHYRQGLLRSLRTSEAMSLKRLGEIRRALGTSDYPVVKGGDAPAPLPSSSRRTLVDVESVFRNASREFARAKKLDAPVAFDPNWTNAEHQQILELEDRKLCLHSIQNSHLDLQGRADGIDAVLNELYSSIGTYKRSSASTSGHENAPVKISDARAEAVVIQQHLRSAPVSHNGELITQILGDVQAAEYFNGGLDRVGLGTGADKVILTLNVLLGYRTGEEEASVRVQDCFLNYLKDQREIFNRRLREMKSNRSIYAYRRLGEWIGLVSHARDAILRSSRDRLQAKAELRRMYATVETSAGAAQDWAKLKFFREGREFGEDTEAERKFTRGRLDLSNRVISFLGSRVPVAQRVNHKLSLLSAAQFDYLLDMFLQLNGKHLPTVQDSARMGEMFASGGQAAASDAQYYGLLGQQLTELQLKLVANKMEAAAKVKDLAQIRK